jgi:hypothetical protein
VSGAATRPLCDPAPSSLHSRGMPLAVRAAMNPESLRLLAGLAFATATTSGCYTIHIARPGTLPLAVATIPPDQRVVAWNRAVAALIDAGFVPQVFNETACYVSARRRDDLGDDILSGAMAIVQVTPEGLVRVQISGLGTFSSQDALNAEIRRRQIDLVQRILHPLVPPSA